MKSQWIIYWRSHLLRIKENQLLSLEPLKNKHANKQKQNNNSPRQTRQTNKNKTKLKQKQKQTKKHTPEYSNTKQVTIE